MDTAVQSLGASPAVLAFPALPTLQTGEFLEPGGVYLDLVRPERGPFVALDGQVAGSGNRYVAKRDVSCPRWWRLVRSAAQGPFAVDEPRQFSRTITPEAASWFAADDALPIAAAP
jgi:hypothetical protein